MFARGRLKVAGGHAVVVDDDVDVREAESEVSSIEMVHVILGGGNDGSC